jgi:hypothetical protein
VIGFFQRCKTLEISLRGETSGFVLAVLWVAVTKH